MTVYRLRFATDKAKNSPEWPTNCSAPVPAKGCLFNCLNCRCGITQAGPFFGEKFGHQWLAAAGTGTLSTAAVPGWPAGSSNQAEWAATQVADPSARGVMTTQWHGGGELPDTTGLRPTADYSWNRAHTSRTSGCAAATGVAAAAQDGAAVHVAAAAPARVTMNLFTAGVSANPWSRGQNVTYRIPSLLHNTVHGVLLALVSERLTGASAIAADSSSTNLVQRRSTDAGVTRQPTQ